MTHRGRYGKGGLGARASGFSLLELLVAIVILLGVTSIVMGAMMQMTLTQGTIGNRTEMHSSVRSATEVLQQEVGQAGKIAPFSTTLSAGVTAGSAPVTVTVGSVAGLFNGEQVLVDAGLMGKNTTFTCPPPLQYANPETVTISNISSPANTFQATFNFNHCTGAPVVVVGAFANGIIPDNATAPTSPSSGTLLRMFGDINADGNMVYVEYKCDTANGVLTRSVTPITAANKNPGQIILSNVIPNPGNAPCFQYQEQTITPYTYVTDVAVTLTVQTANPDPQTQQFQKETKALLNVSPRNIFDAWLLASNSVTTRIQPTPSNVSTLSSQ